MPHSSTSSDRNVSLISRRQRRIDEEHNLAELRRLQAVPGNDSCADCGKRDPQWASIAHGVFVCIRCAGLHRGLTLAYGPSTVRSVTLDSWTPEQLAFLAARGNRHVNGELLSAAAHGNAAPVPPVHSDREMREFLTAKYVRRAFAATAEAALDAGYGDEKKARAVGQGDNDKLGGKLGQQLARLTAMGFADAGANEQALRESGGSMERAVELLVRRAASKAPPAGRDPVVTSASRESVKPSVGLREPRKHGLNELLALGLADEPACAAALERTAGSVELAANLLLEGVGGRRGDRGGGPSQTMSAEGSSAVALPKPPQRPPASRRSTSGGGVSNKAAKPSAVEAAPLLDLFGDNSAASESSVEPALGRAAGISGSGLPMDSAFSQHNQQQQQHQQAFMDALQQESVHQALLRQQIQQNQVLLAQQLQQQQWSSPIAATSSPSSNVSPFAVSSSTPFGVSSGYTAPRGAGPIPSAQSSIAAVSGQATPASGLTGNNPVAGMSASMTGAFAGLDPLSSVAASSSSSGRVSWLAPGGPGTPAASVSMGQGYSVTAQPMAISFHQEQQQQQQNQRTGAAGVAWQTGPFAGAPSWPGTAVAGGATTTTTTTGRLDNAAILALFGAGGSSGTAATPVPSYVAAATPAAAAIGVLPGYTAYPAPNMIPRAMPPAGPTGSFVTPTTGRFETQPMIGPVQPVSANSATSPAYWGSNAATPSHGQFGGN